MPWPWQNNSKTESESTPGIPPEELVSPPYDDGRKRQLSEALKGPERLAPFTDFFIREILKRDHHSVFWGDRMLTLDKAMGFFDDPAFRNAWDGVRGAHVYDQYDNLQSIAWRMHTLVWAAKQALSLPAGDFVECGVFQGDMSFVVYHAASVAGSGRRMHLFDSFEGIDPGRVSPGEYSHSNNYIAEANVHYSKAGLYKSVVDRFAPLKEVSVHKGFLPEALEGNIPEQIGWLHIDLNAARPEVETLEALFDRVVPSGTIILDDYGWLVLRAQKDAEDKFFADRGYSVLELPTGQGLVVKLPGPTQYRSAAVAGVSQALHPVGGADTLRAYADVFEGVTPWSGTVPAGSTVDFLGQQTLHKFLPLATFPLEESEERHVQTRQPLIEDGELWFEAANWVLAARDAREKFVMMTLGANYGNQAVGAALALKQLNPMPFRLVAVEPEPENRRWVEAHMRVNGIDPDTQWIVASAVTDGDSPVLFPVGSPGSGAQNCFATNEPEARAQFADELIRTQRSDDALRSLLVRNSTGLKTNLVEGHDLPAEIELVSSITLRHLLGPFDVVDYIESDIQQSEILVFPPHMDLLKKKVRRIHIGTHGVEVHAELLRLFVAGGWEIVFDFAPNSNFSSALGRFSTNDGVLTVRNPSLFAVP